MTKDGLDNRKTLQEHLNQFSIYDLQRLLDCFKYEYSLPNADKERINEIIECIKNAICRIERK